MSNKKVWDAVNEFKGEWPYNEDNMIRCTRGDSRFDVGNYESYSCRHYSDLNTGAWEAACSRKEFNNLVYMMATNFGTSGVYHHYKNNFKGITTDRLMPIENLPTKETKVDYTSEEFWKDCLIARPKLSPVFTQAQVDSMMHNYGDHKRNSELLFSITRFLVENSIGSPGESCVDIVIRELVEKHNIDTRTDKEKAIDDLSKLVGDCESDYGILEAIIAGKVHGVTWSIKDES